MPSDQSASRPGELVDTAECRRRAGGFLGSWLTLRAQTRARIARDSWSTPRALGPGPESPGTADRPRGPSDPSANGTGEVIDLGGHRTQAARAGQHRGPSDPAPCPLGQLLEPTGPRARARVTGTAGRTLVHLEQNAGCRESWSTPWALEPGPEPPGIVGRARRTSGTGLNDPGQLVEPAGPRARPELPGTARRPRGPSDPCLSRPGSRVDEAGTGILA